MKKRIIDAHDPRVQLDENGCWVWQLSTNQQGRPMMKARIAYCHGVSKQAHRFIYQQHGGVIPEGYHLHHECHNKLCVNPDHMTPMPPSEHRRIKHSPHRAGYQKPRYSPETKMQVVELWLAGESKLELKRRFGCDSKSVSNWVEQVAS